MKTVYVFGNPDIPDDSLPLRLMPALQKSRPEVVFSVLDPNEEWNMGENPTVLDTVIGIPEIRVFNGLSDFADTPKNTCHDFDALWNLRYLQKIGKIKDVTVIGIPPGTDEAEALKTLTKLI